MTYLAEKWKKWRSVKSNGSSEIEYVSLSDLPTREELEQRAIALPIGYRMMLDPHPLEGAERYIKREEAQQTLTATLQRRQEGFAPMLALVGPDGSGRTTLLNWFETHLPVGETVTRIDVKQRIRTEQALLRWLEEVFNLKEGADSIDAVIDTLNKRPPQIVILDDLQRLLLRAMGTTAIVNALLSLMLGTQKHLFWVVSCREYGWRLLDNQFGIGRYFTPVVQLGYFSQEQLREAMRRRVAAAGLTDTGITSEGAEHVPPSDDTWEWYGVFGEAGGAEKPLPIDRYLQDYMTASGGNLHSALFYWQLYTRYDEEKRQLALRKGKRVELSSLHDRGDLDLFTLAEIIINGGLSIEEHAEIFQHEPLKSRVVLEHLYQLRLLEKQNIKASPFYQLNPVFFLPVTAMLGSAHVLY